MIGFVEKRGEGESRISLCTRRHELFFSEIRERHVYTHPNTLAYFIARQCVRNRARICVGQLIRPFVWGWRVAVTGDELVKLHRRLDEEGHVHCTCRPGSLSTCSVPIQIISEACLKIARGEVKKYV